MKGLAPRLFWVWSVALWKTDVTHTEVQHWKSSGPPPSFPLLSFPTQRLCEHLVKVASCLPLSWQIQRPSSPLGILAVSCFLQHAPPPSSQILPKCHCQMKSKCLTHTLPELPSQLNRSLRAAGRPQQGFTAVNRHHDQGNSYKDNI